MPRGFYVLLYAALFALGVLTLKNCKDVSELTEDFDQCGIGVWELQGFEYYYPTEYFEVIDDSI